MKHVLLFPIVLVACGGGMKLMTRDQIGKQVATRCISEPTKGLTVGASKSQAVTVFVTQNGKVMWRGTAPAGGRVEVPRFGGGGTDPVEIDVFNGVVPEDTTLPSGIGDDIGRALSGRHPDVDGATINLTQLPACSNVEGCVPTPCPDPPHDPDLNKR